MKRLIGFIGLFLFIIISFLLIINKPKDYSVEYTYEDYNILEKYNNEEHIYSFMVTKDDNKFYYALSGKYSKKRKLVDKFDLKINSDLDDLTICGTLTVNGEDLPTQCYKDNIYIDYSLLGNKKEPKVIKTEKQIDIYDLDTNYYVWNNKGITLVNDGNNYNFLNKESYTNVLSYKLDNYILFADYDSQRTFNKFYIYDNETKKVTEWKLKQEIYLDSYFLGDFDGFIYLFDRKEKTEYKLNIKKKKITVVSNKDGGIVYKNGWEDVPLEKLVYNNYSFEDNKLYNYSIEDNQLFLTLFGSSYKIKVFEGDVSSILEVKDDKVYFLSGEYLYSFDLKEGNVLLLKCFEWNFSHENKLFIFE